MYKLLFFSFSLFLCFTLSSQSKIFWGNTNNSVIYSSNIDGTNVLSLIGTDFPEDIAYNPNDGFLYWVDGASQRPSINRMNIDGSGNTVLIPNLSSPDGIALDLCNGKMYYIESIPNTISRANLDGSNIEIVVTGLSGGPEGIAIDVQNQNIYWAESSGGRIMKANFNGLNVQPVISGLSGPLKLSKDMSNGQIYFTERTNNRVSRVNGDGTGYTVLNSTIAAPGGIEVDFVNNFIYVSASNGVYRMNLNGTGLTTLVSQTGTKLSLALNGNASACNLAPIPTMNQWGIITLCLLMFIFGAVFMKSSQKDSEVTFE